MAALADRRDTRVLLYDPVAVEKDALEKILRESDGTPIPIKNLGGWHRYVGTREGFFDMWGDVIANCS
tara:strand:- start:835 stop:1038 length:204 start_codon:yes stop_codon:yes gene_type:complete